MPGAPRRAEFRRRVSDGGLYITFGYVNPKGELWASGQGRVAPVVREAEET